MVGVTFFFFFLGKIIQHSAVYSVSAVSPVIADAPEPSGLLSPSSTVRSLTKDLQHSLDLASATSGDKVVTAQVNVNRTVNVSQIKSEC